MCDQNCGVQPADRNTDTHTHTWTDKRVKTEGPKILSNDIMFYFRTVIIGGPIYLFCYVFVQPFVIYVKKYNKMISLSKTSFFRY